MAVTNLLLARALMRAGVSFARPVMLATVWGATLVVATMLAGWVFLGALLPIAYGLQVVPSIWSAYRTWAPSGVAVATWMTILVECVLWGVYGLARQDSALTTLSVIGSAPAGHCGAGRQGKEPCVRSAPSSPGCGNPHPCFPHRKIPCFLTER